MNLPILLVDAGNTCIKCAYLDNGVISKQRYYYYDNKNTPLDLFKKVLSEELKGCSKVFMVSVLGEAFYQEALLVAQSFSVLFATIRSQRQLAGVRSSYSEPEKLGADRLVAMIAAYYLVNSNKLDKKACIIVDSGTATTIDAIDEEGRHLGGLILPGLDLCQSSLLKSTQQLSQWNQASADIVPTLFAKDTTTAINSASIFGLSGAIDSICNKMEKEISKLSKEIRIEKIICGGNSEQLQPYLESKYLYKDGLMMMGLEVILATEEIIWH